MEKRRKILLLSMLTLCICTALIVGGTYALFTDKANVSNHLQAGNLTVGLYRTAYTENTLNAEGFLVRTEVQAQNNEIDGDDIDLRNPENEWLCEVNNAVPQSYFEASLDVQNKGSVAFEYGARIVIEEGADTALAEQIQITITYGDSQRKMFKLSECSENDVDIGVLTTSQSGRFDVKAEFINDDAVNNDAQNQSVKFYVQVYATQKTSN